MNLFKLQVSENLEDLRDRLAGQLSLVMLVIAGGTIWLSLTFDPFPVKFFIFTSCVAIISLASLLNAESRPRFSRWILIFTLIVVLPAAMLIFDEYWITFLSVLLVFTCSILTTGGGLLSALPAALVAVVLQSQGLRSYPLEALAVVLGFSLVVAWLVVQSLNISMEWLRNSNARSIQLLEEARQHRANLSVALRSLNQAYEQQKKMQNDLVWARKRAEEARRNKEQFAANISHELRTPLNLILGFSEIMYVSPQVYGQVNWTAALRQDVYQLYRNSRHLLEMIDDILDLSRFEIVGFSLNLEQTLLGPLLQEAAEIARDLFRNKPVDFIVKISPALPAVEIDRTRVRQVLLNLLNNAARFTSEGAVTLEAHLEKNDILVSVSDTGPGIQEEKLPLIFSEFFQVDPSIRREHGGAGLGLAICKRFVEAHGGIIRAESAPGKGSTFTFSLPLRPFLPGAVIDPASNPVFAQANPRPCVLVVEPDALLVAMLRHLLGDMEVVSVEQISELHDAVLLHNPKVVIVNTLYGDIPAKIEENLPHQLPVVLCELPSRLWLAKLMKAAAFLTKPVVPEELMGEVKKLGHIKTILVIDEDRGFGQYIDRTMRAMGEAVQMIRAYDDQEAIASLAQKPDLILLDLSIAGINTSWLLQQIQVLVDTPVILLANSLNYSPNNQEAVLPSNRKITLMQQKGFQPLAIVRLIHSLVVNPLSS